MVFVGMVLFVLAVVMLGITARNVRPPQNRPASQKTARNSEPSIDTYVLPGLAAVDIHGNLTNKGFELTKDFSDPNQPIWTCTEETGDYRATAIAYGDGSPTKITLVRASFDDFSKRRENRQEAKDFLSFIATLPYDGSEPVKAREWVRSNSGRNKSTVIGGVTFELNARVRGNQTLLMQPAGADD